MNAKEARRTMREKIRLSTGYDLIPSGLMFPFCILFVAFMLCGTYMGGSAMQGKIETSHYLLRKIHGVYTQTDHNTFIFLLWLERFMWASCIPFMFGWFLIRRKRQTDRGQV